MAERPARICPVGLEMAECFIKHKRAIYHAVGDFYFPGLDDAAKETRFKLLNLHVRLDFEGSVTAWEREWGILPIMSIRHRTCMVQLPGEVNRFDFGQYVNTLPDCTAWVARTVSAMVDLARQTQSRDAAERQARGHGEKFRPPRV